MRNSPIRGSQQLYDRLLHDLNIAKGVLQSRRLPKDTIDGFCREVSLKARRVAAGAPANEEEAVGVFSEYLQRRQIENMTTFHHRQRND